MYNKPVSDLVPYMQKKSLKEWSNVYDPNNITKHVFFELYILVHDGHSLGACVSWSNDATIVSPLGNDPVDA